MVIDKNKSVRGIPLWQAKREPVQELVPLCRKMAAEGSVLLKNEGVLPFGKGEKIAVFGRMQESYYKTGSGSGGALNSKSVALIDALRENGVFSIDEELAELYKIWTEHNPFQTNGNWNNKAFSREEMPMEEGLVKKASSRCDGAVIFLGRTCGEECDFAYQKGGYLLSDKEEKLIQLVSKHFKKMVVVLNSGNIIDLSFVEKYSIPALLNCWQGGQEGSHAIADILAGKVSPSGKMPDTLLYNITDSPAFYNFGDREKSIYSDDIYVGYRYFETFAKEKIMYPFGFGMTYTKFDIRYSAKENNGKITVTAEVKNTGDFPAKEVVQIYYDAPCGKLGTPSKQLCAFQKTKELAPNHSETLHLEFLVSSMASYDDCNATGNRSCYVLEKGEYNIYAGTDASTENLVYVHVQAEDTVTERLEEAMAPAQNFQRITASLNIDGEKTLEFQTVEKSTNDLDNRIASRRPKAVAFTGDQGIKLVDVADGKAEMDDFIAQMTDADLCNIVCGEGMNSPKVKPNTGAAMGGVTNSLLALGIPPVGVTDGPSGLRLTPEYTVTALPSGCVFASSFNEALTEEIFDYEGIELFAHNTSALLGPGMNIHRHALCGRNFEYFSEDPLLSGKIASAMSKGLAKSGTTVTIKHLCCNSQETGRRICNAVVSERALREIYLKGFEIAVKEGEVKAVMTAYNPVNGYWSASNYDLTQTILRNEWNYEGFVMTDWWAASNCKGKNGTIENLKAMVRAHNDIYMVCESAESKPHNILEGIEEGYITRGDLQFCAKNILNYIITTPAFEKFVDEGCKTEEYTKFDDSEMKEVFCIEHVAPDTFYTATFGGEKPIEFVFEILSNTEPLIQSSVSVIIDGGKIIPLSIEGTGGKTKTVKRQIKFPDIKEYVIKFQFDPQVELKRFSVKSFSSGL